MYTDIYNFINISEAKYKTQQIVVEPEVMFILKLQKCETAVEMKQRDVLYSGIYLFICLENFYRNDRLQNTSVSPQSINVIINDIL